ncbi:hypothetical protein LTR56_024270 [Elasticomyces elasticus]|nr:hypothetical protein LTR56_024270 [Elasticomyces elasticus]KAK3641122.1 hypothetical protein LTR22_016677 [Elasticomyces elasticus]KAK4905965.1 hypothetical protein LTR49_024819 [Elasticomyces elasticus]KAK5743549.1 hypothetical protein LTS12_023831 [Elasticomyces elasticus]
MTFRRLWSRRAEPSYEDLINRNNQLERSLQTTNGDLAQLRRMRRTAQETLRESKESESRLFDDLKAARSKFDKDIATLKNEFDKDNAALKDDLATAYNQYNRLVTRYSALSIDHGNVVSVDLEARESVQALQAEREQLLRKCQQAENSFQNAKEEAEKARNQLARFKASITSATKLDPQVTDGAVRAKIDQIFYSIQDFALTASRVAKFEASRLIEIRLNGLENYVLDAEKLPKALAPYFITTLIARILFTRFSPEYYFGSPSESIIEDAAQIAAMTKVTNPMETKAWLQPTRKLLSCINEQALQESDKRLLDGALEQSFKILGTLFQDKWHAKSESNLRKIVTAACDLFKLLHESKALFKIDFAGTSLNTERSRFRPEMMQAIGTDEEDGQLDGRQLQMLVFPGVFKYGDEMGDNQNEMTVVCKARVVPQKESHPAGSMQ